MNTITYKNEKRGSKCSSNKSLTSIVNFYNTYYRPLLTEKDLICRDNLKALLNYEEKDIIKNPAFRWEMEQKSGQPLSPCVEVNGTMLADISGEEVERWMLDNGLLVANDTAPDAPINSSCTDAQHAAMAAGQVGKISFIN